MIFTGWESPLALLKYELVQLEYEGVQVPKEIAKRVTCLDDESHKMDFDLVDEIYSDLNNLKVSSSFPYEQPYTLTEIKKARPSGPRRFDSIEDKDLLDKFHGAWTGRAVGCALGKPVEGMGIRGQKGLIGRAAIKEYLKNRNHWPLDYYFSGEDVGDDFVVYCPNSQRENIAFMEPDDDIHYTLIALAIMEKYGAEFTWRHIAHTWNSCLPYNVICTAESQAILNYNNASPRSTASDWVTPEYTSLNRNPYREWIGAQIRADIFGYAAPGWPEKAAALAFQDGCISHQKNGIYGEMFVAAMISASFVFEAIDDIVDAGLGEIPENCRLAEAVNDVQTWCHSLNDWEEIFKKILDKYGHYHGVHTINNAALVVLGLYSGQDSFESGIVTAVRAGWDTDCNGATVGSILGVRCGSKKLPGKWVDKFNDRLMSAVKGHNENRFSSLAKRTVQVAKKVLNSPAEQEAVSTKETSPGGCWDLETGWGRQRVNFDAGTIKFLEDGFEPYPITACQYQGETLNFSFAIDKGGWDFEVDFEGIVNADAIEGSFFPGDTPVQGKRSVSTEEDSAESSSS